MCGIAGIYNFKKDTSVKESDVNRMRDSLAHRGPDGVGTYISPNGRVGLGHRRLAIIDLTPLGAQPMTNDDRSVWITFNGEIYNFQDLRADLEHKGYRFRSKSDTETIIHGYTEYGVDVVKYLNGMFAFVIWDEKKQIFFAARDHLGVKPLYYAIQNGTFFFGSEIKAILAHPEFKKQFAEENATHYLTFAALPAPLTLFKDVQKLPAATWLTVSPDGHIETHEYWSPMGAENKYPKDADESFYISHIRDILRDSIKRQMVSDVPFGCFLSGGIDSSLNATLMSEALGKPVETFSIGSDTHEKYNEFQYSRDTARRLGAHTHEIVVGRKDLMEFLPQYGTHADDPNGDQICFLVYYLSKLTRDNGVIVAQVGEGSDEIFAGYNSYGLAVSLHEKLWRFAEMLPRSLRGLPYATLKHIPSTRFDFEREYTRRLKDGEEPFWGNAIAFSESEKYLVLSNKYRTSTNNTPSYNFIRQCYEEASSRETNTDFLERMTYLELKIRLSELLLMRVDKMAMAHSIEPRVPFLDTRLVELALHIPQATKLKNGTTKYILKKAAEGIIPNEIIYRKKQGFGAPVKEWLKDKESAAPFLDIVRNSRIHERNIFNRDGIERLFNAHQLGADDHNFRIWNLVTLSLWYDKWFGN